MALALQHVLVMNPSPPNNDEAADTLDQIAMFLEAQGAGAFRIRAYRAAAQMVREHPEPMAHLLEKEGKAGLEALPTIGKSIASTIAEYIRTGRIGLLERLEGQVSPEDLFATVPGIGESLAHTIHLELGVDTLEELEIAAHDGRLERLDGFGTRRALAIREALASRLRYSTRRRAQRLRWLEAHGHHVAHHGPAVQTILAIDKEYRLSANRGELQTIAPRRFNLEGKSWLPVLHTERDGLSFTAMYSNTARAHALGMTHDWVLVFDECDGEEDQCTVVTERNGPLAGLRVIRGRETECASYYSHEKAVLSEEDVNHPARA